MMGSSNYSKCALCGGRGYQDIPDYGCLSCGHTGHYRDGSVCFSCQGRGALRYEMRKNTCVYCSGTGKGAYTNNSHSSKGKVDSKNSGETIIFLGLFVAFFWLWKQMEGYALLEFPFNYIAGLYNYIFREPLIVFFNGASIFLSAVWNHGLTDSSGGDFFISLAVTLLLAVCSIALIKKFWDFLADKYSKSKSVKYFLYGLVVVYVAPILILVVILLINLALKLF
jgi:hypothetical protein